MDSRDRVGRGDGAAQAAIRGGPPAGGADLEHRIDHEPEPTGAQGLDGVLRCVDAWPLATQPLATRTDRRGRLASERLRLLNAGSRSRPPCRGRP